VNSIGASLQWAALAPTRNADYSRQVLSVASGHQWIERERRFVPVNAGHGSKPAMMINHLEPTLAALNPRPRLAESTLKADRGKLEINTGIAGNPICQARFEIAIPVNRNGDDLALSRFRIDMMATLDALKNPTLGLDQAAHLQPAYRLHTATSKI